MRVKTGDILLFFAFCCKYAIRVMAFFLFDEVCIYIHIETREVILESFFFSGGSIRGVFPSVVFLLCPLISNQCISVWLVYSYVLAIYVGQHWYFESCFREMIPSGYLCTICVNRLQADLSKGKSKFMNTMCCS